MAPLTPLPEIAVRRLALLVTGGAVCWVIKDFPDVDEHGRKNVLFFVKERSKAAYASLVHVSDEDREAVYRSGRRRPPTPPSDAS